MKKILLALVFMAGMFSANATQYTDMITVTLNGAVAGASNATIEVKEQANGKQMLLLNNFVLNSPENAMPVGNIAIEATPYEENGNTYLYANQNINITNGDASQAFWMGPNLGPVPVKLLAQLSNGKLYAVIDINFAVMNIKVQFGDGYQIPNSDFEKFHTVNNNQEPNHWHTFTTSTGMLASMVNSGKQATSSSQTRPGTAGNKSVVISSRSPFFGIVANGTLTTGRLNAGGVSAASTANHSYLDISSTDKDNNGDSFYTLLAGRPDSLVFWTRFKQGTPSNQYPYATATAVITDGTRYQQPEDKVYTNHLAKAENAKIESKGGVWQRISIPFQTTNSDVTPKAILVTISTNATPGKGSSSDSIWVDDMSLVYNLGVKNIKVKGQSLAGFNANTSSYAYDKTATLTADDIVVETESKNPVVLKSIDASQATIIVASNDLMESKTYTLNLTTGISNLATDTNASETAIYNLNGVRVNKATTKGVYIIKDSKGNTKKVIRK